MSSSNNNKKRRNAVSFEHEKETPRNTRRRSDDTTHHHRHPTTKTTAFIAVPPLGGNETDIVTCSNIWKHQYDMNVVFVGLNKDQECCISDNHSITPSLSFKDLVEMYDHHDDDDDDDSNTTTVHRASSGKSVLLLPGGNVGVNLLLQSESFMTFLQYHYLVNTNNLVVACGASAVRILTTIMTINNNKKKNNNSLVDRLGPTCYSSTSSSSCLVLYKERRNVWTSPGGTIACVQQVATKVGDELCGRVPILLLQMERQGMQQQQDLEGAATTSTTEESTSKMVNQAARESSKRPAVLTKSSRVRDVHHAAAVISNDNNDDDSEAEFEDDEDQATNQTETAAVAVAPSLQPRADTESCQDSSDPPNTDGEERSVPRAPSRATPSMHGTLKSSELATARFWKYIWRPLSRHHGWWLRTVGGRHHYMTPGSTFALQTRGTRWFESKRGVLDYLRQNKNDVYESLLKALKRHEAISVPGDGELQSLVEALQEQEQLKSVESKEDKPTQKAAAHAIRRVTNEREGVVSTNRSENKLFAHIVWPRLRVLGWTLVKNHGSNSIRYRPSAEEAPLTDPASVLEFLWTSPRWCLRTKVMCLLDLYESCKSIQKEFGDGVALADVEAEAKRRRPALAAY